MSQFKLAHKGPTYQKLSSGHTCAYYLAWFFRLYRGSDSGWDLARTPDDRALMYQDAYFIRALEEIARTLTLMLAEERKKG